MYFVDQPAMASLINPIPHHMTVCAVYCFLSNKDTTYLGVEMLCVTPALDGSALTRERRE